MRYPKHFRPCAFIPLFAFALSACSGGGASLPSRAGTAVTPIGGQVPRTAVSTGPSFGAPGPTAAIPAGEMALTADSLPGDPDANNNFIDSIGVNTKLNYSGSVYANYPAVKAALLSLGVRHIRDEFSTQGLNNYENNLSDLARSGIHSVLGLTIAPDAHNNAVVNVSGAQAAAYLQAGHYAASIEAVEGFNEPDVNQSAPNGPSPTGWAAITQTQQKALYNGIQLLTLPAKRIPVYGPSVLVNADLQQVGDLSAYMDDGNIHDYSGGYDLPAATIASVLASEQTLSGSKPVVATENGYSTGTTGQSMPNSVMLDYAPRLFFKQFTHTIKRTLWYELLDEDATPNDYWKNSGLLTSTYAPKPAFTGLKNVITLLKDPTPYRPRTALSYSFGGQTQFENIEHLLLQKNDGSFWLVVWRDIGEWNPAANGLPGSAPAPAATPIPNSLNFLGTYVASITQYIEDNTGAMVSTPVAVSAGSTAQVAIGSRPTIFKIVPGTAPPAPVAPAVASPAAHWSLDEGSGAVAADSVNAGGNLAVPTNGKVAWIAGRYKSGLSFNGSEAPTGATPIDTSQSYSATAWIQMNDLTDYQAAVSVSGVHYAAFALDFTPQSNLSFTTYGSDVNAPQLTRIGSTIVPVIGQWYAVAATYNGTTRLMSFYVNGALQSTGTATSVFKATGGTQIGAMLQGGIGNWQWLNGGVDEVNLYGRQLTAAEVRTMAGL